MNLIKLNDDQIKRALKEGKITVSVIGLGRIGLPTAAIFADNGINVIGVDKNNKIIEMLKNGKNYIDEPGLDEIIERIQEKGRFKVTSDLNSAISNSDMIIICVPTPVTNENIPDYSIIKQVIIKLSEILKPYQVIIIESTISPGTVENLLIPLLEKGSGLKCGKDFFIASCPERADPGKIINIFKNTPRIIGGITKNCTDITAAIYSNVIDADIIKMSNPKTANAVKLTENIFRDVNIALINELAILFERLDINIYDVIDAASTKWNFVPHYPGPGVGGPCLPANPYYLIQEAIEVGYIPYLIKIAREINDRMPDHIVELIQKTLNYAGKAVKNSIISILGLSYKPDIKDMQLTPSIPIINKLKSLYAKLKIFDPFFIAEEIQGIITENSLESAIMDSDCIVIITNHQIFENIDLDEVQKLAKKPFIIVDGRNALKSRNLPKNFIYQCVGRPILIT
ncbi:MAG: nucleotide sugar dehydrogenase [Candidatus Helarchaeota archaeon]